ncbi:TetR/AcrR family transcriptional regulator [Nocardioides glacieisoli]|uniref:TetR/AcrR family transcriptional regulator n=1 Tax=Nocardioides glacieisoli TaxID=1168730 RepID=A0A4Q2RMY4_9ACTN|nr:TetR/AcrR family transcriptional regulator [Nocardioides glacieisoli]RYB89898.1 TetR/AcrR family transcriptional regulator [Nocardioides glacieisoli]
MRSSKKVEILDAAVAVIEAEGITGVTFDTVADAAGVTRGGVIYHFASRDNLIAALHEHLAEQWEAKLESVCGKPAEEATQRERLVAYIAMASTSATRSQVHMILDSFNNANHRVWVDVLSRWAPSRDDVDDQTQLALIAADGLWLNELLGSAPLSQADRQHMAQRIIDQLPETEEQDS